MPNAKLSEWCAYQEVTKFLADSLGLTTHAIQLVDPFEAAHPLIILHQLCTVISYYDVYSPSIADYDNEDIPKIHLIAEEPPQDPSTAEYSERETGILDH